MIALWNSLIGLVTCWLEGIRYDLLNGHECSQILEMMVD